MKEIRAALVREIRKHPRLLLANVKVWLDPVPEYEEDNYYEDDYNEYGSLEVLRTHFPDVYSQVVQAIHHDGDINEIVVDALDKRNFPIERWTDIAYYIPLPCYGINIFAEPLEDYHPMVATFVGWFVEAMGLDATSFIISDIGFELARMLARRKLHNLSYATQWIFSSSGNSIVDLDAEGFSDLTPLEWGELEFAVEILTEANEIMEQAYTGLNEMQEPRVQAFLKRRIAALVPQLERLNDRNRRRH